MHHKCGSFFFGKCKTAAILVLWFFIFLPFLVADRRFLCSGVFQQLLLHITPLPRLQLVSVLYLFFFFFFGRAFAECVSVFWGERGRPVLPVFPSDVISWQNGRGVPCCGKAHKSLV